jgi:hypothetical protein
MTSEYVIGLRRRRKWATGYEIRSIVGLEKTNCWNIIPMKANDKDRSDIGGAVMRETTIEWRKKKYRHFRL